MFKIINTDKYDSLVERILYCSYFVYQFMFLLHVSSLNQAVKSFDLFTTVSIIISFAIILLIDLYYFLRGKYNFREIIIYGIVGIFLLISLYNYRDVMVAVNLFAIMAFKNANPYKALKLYLIATIIGMICVFLISIFTPYTSNDVQIRYGTERIRYGLGFYYATFVAHYLFSILLVFLIVCKNIKLYHYLIFAILNIVIFILTDTKAPFVYIWMIIIIHIVLTRIKNDFLINFYKLLTILSYPVLSLVTIILSLYYDSSNSFMNIFNKILTGRLSLTHNALEICGYKLFGQTVGIWGDGFYIDSSFVNMLVLNGLIVFIISIALMTIFSYMSAKNENIPLMIALSFFALRSAFDWGFMALQMTPVVIMFYNELERYKLIKGNGYVKTN